MADKIHEAKRLAKNTTFMYVRMFLLMIISLYSSRVVLHELGIDDYGLYNVVGSVVAMFASVRTVFATSTQRFLNYEMGRQNYDRLPVIFSTSIMINILISLIFILLVELVGLFFIHYYINIEPSRSLAAMIVFQLSIITAVISTFNTTFDALIIAHERMSFFAYISVAEGILKLAIVFILPYLGYDKLISYAFLILGVTGLILLINIIYCKLHFVESKFSLCFERDIFKQMSSFAAWHFCGVTAYTMTQSGLNMVMNVFGGTVVNAARGISYQVTGALNNFTNNIAVVINPYGIKLYSSGKQEEFYDVTYFSSKVLFFIQLLIVIVFCYNTNMILSIWLIEVPPYTVVFLQLVLVNSLVRSLHSPLDLVFRSAGEMKYYQLSEAFILALPLFFSYIFLKLGIDFIIVFVLMIFFEIINLITMLILAKIFIQMNVLKYCKQVFTFCIPLLFIPLGGFYIVQNTNLLNALIVSLVVVILTMLLSFVFLNTKEKLLLLKMIPNLNKRN